MKFTFRSALEASVRERAAFPHRPRRAAASRRRLLLGALGPQTPQSQDRKRPELRGGILRRRPASHGPETGEAYGLNILNDGKYGLDVRGEEVGLTVLRSPIYAHHDPFVPQPDESYSFVDQGIQRFTYACLPHSGG